MSEKIEDHPKLNSLADFENPEIRFFCEALSLVDSVNNCNLVPQFSNKVKDAAGGPLQWADIGGLFPTGMKAVTYIQTIDRVSHLVEQVVKKGWITSLRTRSLAHIADEAATQYCEEKGRKIDRNRNDEVRDRKSSPKLFKAWKDVAQKLLELAEFQEEHMNYHADFQKTNYLPHPDSWKVYTGTLTLIFLCMIYSVLV